MESIGSEVIYCCDQDERRAQVCNIEEDGQVHLAVYSKNNPNTIDFGVTDAKLASVPAERITHGYYWHR